MAFVHYSCPISSPRWCSLILFFSVYLREERYCLAHRGEGEGFSHLMWLPDTLLGVMRQKLCLWMVSTERCWVSCSQINSELRHNLPPQCIFFSEIALERWHIVTRMSEVQKCSSSGAKFWYQNPVQQFISTEGLCRVRCQPLEQQQPFKIRHWSCRKSVSLVFVHVLFLPSQPLR